MIGGNEAWSDDTCGTVSIHYNNNNNNGFKHKCPRSRQHSPQKNTPSKHPDSNFVRKGGLCLSFSASLYLFSSPKSREIESGGFGLLADNEIMKRKIWVRGRGS
ncbi:hypothetical protein GQ457_02G001380 [Hibiscus cannabinus]